jgi:alanyl-tRNA synthetase
MSKAPHGQHLHHLTLDYGVIKVGDKVQLEIDGVARRSIMLNHSATHLLHRALNDVLGSEVSQAGSYVGPDYLRFDFNYNTRVTDEELEKIELIVNKYISDSVPLTVKYMTLAEAQKLGAKALFMEKYGDLVRVVTFAGISVELCGGTHIDNTSKIGTFVIVSESSIASGVRRIVALTGLAAYEHLKTYSDTVKRISKELGLNDKKDVVPHVRTLVEKNALLNSEVIALKTQELHRIASALTPKKHGDTNIYLEYFTTSNREDLGVIADKVRSTDECALLVLVGNKTNDFPLLISVSKELSKSLNANKVMRALTSTFGGRGGGRPDFANGVLLNLPEKTKALATILKVLDE